MKNNFGSKAECTGPQTSQSAGKEQSKHFSAILGRRYGLPPSGTETRIRNCLVNNVVVVAAGVVAGLKRVGGIRNHRNPPPPGRVLWMFYMRWMRLASALYAKQDPGERRWEGKRGATHSATYRRGEKWAKKKGTGL